MAPKPGIKQLFPFSLVLTLILLLVSCDPTSPVKTGPFDLFAGALKTQLKQVPASDKKTIGTVAGNLRRAYEANNYHPIWLTESYSTGEAAQKLIDELEDMRWDGFDARRYPVDALKRLKIKLDTTKINSLHDAIAFDTLMTHAYLAAAKDLLLGAVLPRKADSLWHHANDSTWSAPEALAAMNDKYPSLYDYRSTVPTYGLLRTEYERYCTLAEDSELTGAIDAMHGIKAPGASAKEHMDLIIKKEMPWIETVPDDTISGEKQLVMAYQAYAGIWPTGKTDSATLQCLAQPISRILEKIKANMERVRWMQQDFGNLYIIVDVPLMELFLRKDGINEMHMRVVAGKVERQTPSLYAVMANVVINPPWGVPPTILKQDVVPGFEKNGKKYLAKKGLKAYDRQGNVVKSSLLNMQNLKQYTYKQAPGDDNSLGVVKFNLPNPWDIYLHDTPHRGDFVKRYRALSSGCIRLEQPREMAVYILSGLEKKKVHTGQAGYDDSHTHNPVGAAENQDTSAHYLSHGI